MKKNTIKAFTLVEMLIVIVIIGILIAALMPRMQAAQWRARDVSRKTALSQVQSAIVVSQWDKWAWPGMPKNNVWLGEGKSAAAWLDLNDIKKQLEAAWMNWVPEDPLRASVSWLWDEWEKWQYRYMVVTRNWTPAWWFILMAKTEVEWWSNFVVCDSTSITSGTDITDTDSFRVCTSIKQSEEGDQDECVDAVEGEGACVFKTDDQLRYVVVY